MRTAADVLKTIDDQLDKLQLEASSACIDAVLAGDEDTDVHGEAFRRAAVLKHMQGLRTTIVDEMTRALRATDAAPAKRSRKAQ